ncbi:MAG: HAMP domain-containing sensor histidine kinase [Candidatus Moranbacteria bacterium]|nr:HAMP domain-containing sensor histidine kinase [Candidatus Moranbacteria bacterium]
MLVLILLPLLLYFAYYLLQIKISLIKHIFVWIPFVPLFVLSFSRYSYLLFSIERVGSDCVVQEEALYPYVYALSAFYIVWFVLILFKKYKSSKDDSIIKNKIKTVIVAASVLIGWFVLLIKLQSFFGDSVLLFIPLGMVMFIGILSYAIVKYKLFNIKLLTAQAIVALLVFLIGALIFMQDPTKMRVVIWITLALAIIFGRYLVKSVKAEVRKSEELEIANKEINERKEQLQLMADKLAQANDQLRTLDNAKTEFISIASHQLRTPITAIKGFSSLLLEGSYGEVSESVHSALEKVYSSAERLVDLVEDLLNVSRIESGRMQFTFEKASVEKLIKELYDNFILIAKNKKFYLDIKLPENPLPEIVMDYSKIRELVSNFIDNALKYTEKGGATVKAELREEGVVVDENGFVIVGKKSEFGKVIRITVSDTGIGIPKEEIPYLFKKFSRGKDVSRLHVGGTGLGLYVGKAIAETHHGQVWVESDGAGKGSRFIIEIPVEHIA